MSRYLKLLALALALGSTAALVGCGKEEKKDGKMGDTKKDGKMGDGKMGDGKM